MKYLFICYNSIILFLLYFKRQVSSIATSPERNHIWSCSQNYIFYGMYFNLNPFWLQSTRLSLVQTVNVRQYVVDKHPNQMDCNIDNDISFETFFSQMASFRKLTKEFIMGMCDGFTVPFGFSDIERWLKVMRNRPRYFQRFQGKNIIYKEKKQPLYKVFSF